MRNEMKNSVSKGQNNDCCRSVNATYCRRRFRRLGSGIDLNTCSHNVLPILSDFALHRGFFFDGSVTDSNEISPVSPAIVVP